MPTRTRTTTLVVSACLALAGPVRALLAVAAPQRVEPVAELRAGGALTFAGAAERVWEKGDGLPSGTVSDFAETVDGTLWIGTEEGVVSFDGQRLVTVLRGEYAEALVSTPKGLLVGSGVSGVVVLRDGRRVPSPVAAATHGHSTGALIPHEDGGILGTLDGLLFHLEADRVVRELGAGATLPKAQIRSLAVVQGTLAVGTEDGLRWLSLDRDVMVAAEGVLAKTSITGLGASGDELVVATEVEGLWHCRARACDRFPLPPDLGGARFGHVTAFEGGAVLVASSSGVVRVADGAVSIIDSTHRGVGVAMHRSRSGVLWLGAAGDANFEGMRALAVRGVSVWHRATSSTRAVQVMDDGAALIATDADGLWRREANGEEKRVPLGLSGLESVRVIRPSSEGSWLVGGLNGVVRLRADGRQDVVVDSKAAWGKVRSIVERPGGDVLFGSTAGVWRQSRGIAPRLLAGVPSTAFVFAITPIAGNRWLITTQMDGLFVVDDGDVARSVALPAPFAMGSLLTPGRIRGGLVVVPHDRGLCVLDELTLAARCFGAESGLEATTHLGVASDGAGRLWIPTNAGITSLDEAAFAQAARSRSAEPFTGVRHFNSHDGMPVGECNGGDPNVLRLVDGRMAFACVGGIVVIDPAKARIDTQPPYVIVESADIDGVVHRDPFDAPLDAESQRVTFTFSAPSFLGDERNQRFLVKLDGFDRDWVEGDRATFRASYTNLPRGRLLRFSVRASNHDGVWSENAASFAFRIAPRWYERPGLQAAAALALSALLFGAYKARTRQLKSRAASLEVQVRARTADLVKAHEETERLLLNILPPRIAARLKAGERLIADRFDQAAVLFADVVGFTPRSASMPPEVLVRVLDELFLAFDARLAEHRVEKVKTIGDAYMAVAGVPEALPDAAARLARFALSANEVAGSLRWPDGAPIQLRFGLHVGPVVAGVVGERKTIYDLWGDTVNVASRMESHGEAARIHVSEAFAEAVGPSFRLVDRGLHEVKGIGRVRTYWLES